MLQHTSYQAVCYFSLCNLISHNPDKHSDKMTDHLYLCTPGIRIYNSDECASAKVPKSRPRMSHQGTRKASLVDCALGWYYGSLKAGGSKAAG